MATRETAKILTRGAHPSSVAGGPHHLLGAESLPPLRNPLNSPGIHPGTNLQPHPPTTITTAAFKKTFSKRGLEDPILRWAPHRVSQSSVHAGKRSFPGTLLQLLHEHYPTDHQSSIHVTGARPAAAPTRAHTHTVQRNGSLKSLREQSWDVSGHGSRGAAGVGTSVHGLQRLAPGVR